MKRENQSEIMCSGTYSVALGINTKIATNGLCGHPNKRPINPNMLDGLPIPEFGWTHCIFCSEDMKHCYFAGECEHRLPESK